VERQKYQQMIKQTCYFVQFDYYRYFPARFVPVMFRLLALFSSGLDFDL